MSEDVCIFSNIQEMASREAPCWHHRKKCIVKGVDLLIVGTSCKDLSRANSSAGAAGPAFSHETTRGGSAQTFKGLVAYIRVHRPLLVIYENVDALDDNAADGALNNMDILCAEMSALGYDMQKLLTDAASFGLPQRRLGSGLGWVGEACGDGSERTGRGGGRGQRAGRVAPAWRCPGAPRAPWRWWRCLGRRRYYIVFLQVVSNPSIELAGRSVDRVFGTLRHLVAVCQRRPPCLSTVLLPCDHPAVLKDGSSESAHPRHGRARQLCAQYIVHDS